MSIDLSTVPAPQVIEPLDYETILAAMKADLVARDPAFTALVESDPAMKILEVCAYREVLMRQRVNDAARSVMLAYAVNGDLDQLAVFFGVTRKVIAPADTSAIPPVPAIMENDAAFRRRILFSLDGISTAGPKNAYIFHALSVPGVRDASVMAPPDAGIPPGHVSVHILSDAPDGAAAPALIAAVAAVLNAEDVRPLTDVVTVSGGSIKDYAITASIYVYPGPDSALVLENARDAIEKYTSDNFRLGRDITLSGIYAALHASGVQRVELAAPSASIINTPAECARCTAINIHIAGTDE